MPANIERFLCVIGAQRSGTIALESALEASNLFCNFSEIFQTADLREPGNYLDYATERKILATDLATHADARRVMDAYFVYLEQLAGPKLPLVDIKYNAWNALRPFWGFATEEPLLLKEMRTRGARFIFVMRRDLAAQIMSEWIARATGQWHRLQEDHPIAPFEIPKKAALHRAQLIIESEKRFHAYLKDCNQIFRVYYEDMYQDGAVSPKLAGWLQERFSITCSEPLVPQMSANKVAKKVAVANYDDVQQAVAKLIANVGRVEF